MLRYAFFFTFLVGLLACNGSKEDRESKVESITSDHRQMEQKLSVGSFAPNFSLPDPEGNLVQLSDFYGKYVFLDFWASWCQPCRKENPDLVKIYDRFKNQNFEIVGIALDKKKDRWLNAVKSDGLEWPQLSDLKYFDSEIIELYGIVNVPTTLLLDPEGKIIAKNLHASDLEKKLSELLL